MLVPSHLQITSALVFLAVRPHAVTASSLRQSEQQQGNDRRSFSQRKQIFGPTGTHFLEKDHRNDLEALLEGGFMDDIVIPSDKSVVIVGAGAAGLSAAWTLRNQGLSDVTILEASDDFGGRIQKSTTFTDFDVDLGPSFVQYPNDIRNIMGRNVLSTPSGTGLPIFFDYTYYDFFADYIVDPGVTIEYNCEVDSINYENAGVELACGQYTFTSDYAVVTVPLPILKGQHISFTPALPGYIVNHPAFMWQGFKIFLECSTNFFGGFCLQELDDDYGGSCIDAYGENLFWDYSSVHNTDKVIMAGYILGEPSEAFVSKTDEQIKDDVLQLLDNKFPSEDPPPSSSCSKYLVVNWSENPHVQGTLSAVTGQLPSQYRGALNVDDKVFIAGEHLPVDGNYGWVDAGAYSGDDAAKQILSLATGQTVTSDFYERVALAQNR